VQSVIAQNTSSNGLASYYKGLPADCDKAALAVPSGGVGITLSVFVYSGLTTGTPTYTDSWDQFGFDLIGPNPPATVTMGIADSELHLHWSSVLDSDRAGFNIYCEPAGAPIDAGVSDSGVQIATGGAATGGAASGTGGDLGTGGTTSTLDAGVENLNCPSANIQQGLPPSVGISPKGSASTITATDAYAHGVSNGTSYACAISVTDVMQNDGPLSTVVCGTPKPVDDFYTSYRKAGGKAGGGFCSIRKPGVGVGPMIALASLAMLALRRRRRSKVENGDGTR
jgi:MYXO-CTERM domain-containing protein